MMFYFSLVVVGVSVGLATKQKKVLPDGEEGKFGNVGSGKIALSKMQIFYHDSPDV